MDYQIDHDPIDRGHLVVASGELDIQATPRLSTVLAMAATSPGGRLVLDLSEVTFIDSTALGVLIEARSKVSDRSAFVLAAPGLETRRALEVSGLDRHFTVESTVADAIAAGS